MNLIKKCMAVLCGLFIFITHELAGWGSSQPSINNSNVNNITNTISVDVTTEVATAVYNQIKEGIRAIADTIKKAYETVSTTTISYTRRLSKGTLFLGAIAGGYVTGTGVNVWLKSYLSSPLRWCRWNEQINLENLFLIPQDQLGTELVKEIQRRYTNSSNPVDFITPFIFFMRDIEQEKRALEWYQRLGTVQNKLYLGKIMFHDKTLLENCDKWLQRVAYLNAVFIHWMADFKFLQNARVLSFLMKNRLLATQQLRRHLVPLWAW